ncbi:MAG: IS1634 family transposase [Prochloraceae cyanobacterium]|nr:IS1634 family transposase [Prochloraceae cyanobacterium]
MGFISSPLYLFPHFFNDKATEHLFGDGILPEDFNDDKIGRVLDKLYEFGLDKIFLAISLKACQIYGIDRSYSHLDSSSISVEGDYLICDKENSEDNEPTPIKIVHGHSKDRRPDLKQFLVNLISSGDNGVPLFFQCGNGNDSDKAKFTELISNFKKQVDFDSIFVADSALYSAENLLAIKHLKWITRVPLSIKAAQIYVKEIPESEFADTDLEGYKAVERESNYGGIKQRWIIIESQARKESDLEKLSKNLTKNEEKARSLVKTLSQKKYENRTEIKAVFKCEEKKLKYHRLILDDFSKTLDKKTKEPIYKATISFELKREKVEDERKKAGRFILATNVLKNLTPSEILTRYKGQQSCESGFKFLKDPLFFADSVFLKNPSRIEAMAMLMGLSLLVYTLGQRQLRANLQQNNTKVKNNTGKLTDKPTLRWIFQCFQGIHVVIINGVKQISNLTDSRLTTINNFSKSCQRYYILSG